MLVIVQSWRLQLNSTLFKLVLIELNPVRASFKISSLGVSEVLQHVHFAAFSLND